MAIAADDVDLDRDRVLVERFQRGDQRAFDELYRRYYRRLCRFCERRVHDPATAEELAQEAFARAVVRLDHLSGDLRFYPWLTVIAGRLCIDHHRREARVDTMPTVEPAAAPGDHHEAVFAEVDRRHLDAALGRLKPRHREVLELREYQELRYDGIASRLGVPSSTVEALLHRARLALRREFFAVSGEGPGAVAGLGVVVWLVRRLRGRASAAVAAAVPVTLVAAVVAIGFLPAPTAGPATSSLPPTRAVASIPTAATPSAAPSTPAAVPSAPTPGAIAPPRPAPATSAGPAELFIGSDAARRRAARLPVGTAAGPLVVGADPAAALADTLSAVAEPILEVPVP